MKHKRFNKGDVIRAYQRHGVLCRNAGLYIDKDGVADGKREKPLPARTEAKGFS